MDYFFDDLHVAGRWRAGGDGERLAVTDPADGSTITTFAVASLGDCDLAVGAAAEALPGWAATPPRERPEILRRAFELLAGHADRLTELMVRENGKSCADAQAEARYATEYFRWFAEEAVRIDGDYRLSPSGDKHIVVTHEPIGVSLLVTPWDFPAAMAARKLGPALAAGCTTILKPAPETPLTAAYIVGALTDAGVPPGVVNLVLPEPAGPAVRRMLAHPAVRKLSFTGSTEVGRELLETCAGTVVSASMELGGNAPLVVLPGADLDHTVPQALLAKMRNGGCACTAANRFYVHSSVHAEFVERFAALVAGLRTGPGADPRTDVGALVSVSERDKIADLVDLAVLEGAEVVVGGRPAGPGHFYEPTVLTGVRHGTRINATEIFGPVVAIVEVGSEDEAVRLANDTVHGLMAYVFGEERAAMRIARRLEFGMVAVNRGVVSDPVAPFGGTKQSGLGREGGFEGIHEFLEQKYIAVTP